MIIYEGALAPDSEVKMAVQVNAPFETAGAILSTTTPAGRVARTVHVGAYGGIPRAHAAIVEWCAERGLKLAGRSWEVYGDHHDDPARLQTEVMHLLA